MKMHLENEFKAYIHKCYGEEPLHPIQRKEIERAFMAGAMCFFWRVMQDPSPECLQDLDTEMEIYASDVKRNRK